MLVAALVAFTLPAAAAIDLRDRCGRSGLALLHTRSRWPRAHRTEASPSARSLFVLALQALIVLNLSGSRLAAAHRAACRRRAVRTLSSSPSATPCREHARTTSSASARRGRSTIVSSGYGFTASLDTLRSPPGRHIAIAGVFFAKNVVGWVVSTSALGGTATLARLYVAKSAGYGVDRRGASGSAAWQIALWIVRVLLAPRCSSISASRSSLAIRAACGCACSPTSDSANGSASSPALSRQAALFFCWSRAARCRAPSFLAAAMVGALLVHVFVIGVGFPTVIVCLLLAMLIGVGLASRT